VSAAGPENRSAALFVWPSCTHVRPRSDREALPHEKRWRPRSHWRL